MGTDKNIKLHIVTDIKVCYCMLILEEKLIVTPHSNG